jgi:DNA (cytosine-5)-methyltransferase 1
VTAAYYNECDPFKAEVLRQAIAAGAIAPGEVDERSIVDVRADDVRGFTQCHWFAGGGFWSLALRQAGWPDNRAVWTGSCPCPSFSAAGKGRGFDDPRHLWPAWFRLIRECRPASLIGEQVAAAIGHGWLDLVSTDLEAEGYAVAAAVLGAHSVGAPHRRQRLYFCADSTGKQEYATAERRFHSESGECGAALSGADNASAGLEGAAGTSLPRGGLRSAINGETLIGNDPLSPRLEGHFGDVRDWRGPEWLDPLTARSVAEAGATRGFWADCDWWYGRDGKYRPAKPGIFVLASRHSESVSALHAIEKAAWEEIESYGYSNEADPRQMLRMVRDNIQSQANREGQRTGMREQLLETQVLLSFLLCVESACAASDRQGEPKAHEEAKEVYMRSLRIAEGVGKPPRRWEPTEQCGDESTDVVCDLSRVLACHAEAYRTATFTAHATANRVGALRLAGDAIVIPLAKAFIEAYLETEGMSL